MQVQIRGKSDPGNKVDKMYYQVPMITFLSGNTSSPFFAFRDTWFCFSQKVDVCLQCRSSESCNPRGFTCSDVEQEGTKEAYGSEILLNDLAVIEILGCQ